MDRTALDRLLLEPECYPGGFGKVELIETHLSRLYFVASRTRGAHVFKIKKVVDFGFVDFSTLEKRRQACEDEVRLNRRMAPRVYLGVVPIVVDAERRVRVGGKGEAIEYAVEMEQLPAECMLDAKLERGEIDRPLVERLAATLADFHARAARGPEIDAFATPDTIRRRLLENLDGATTAPPAIAKHLRLAFERFVRERRDLLDRRVSQRRIVEGHGDLHAGNLCLVGNEVLAFDCIEFSRELRCLDVAADLAFLLMDLDRLGFAAFGLDVARHYAERACDPELFELLPLYKSHLALVRGKVAALREAGSDDAAVRARSRAESLRFFALATRYALPPVLLVTCGLPGSGKTFVAQSLASALDLVHVQADFERKRMAGIPPDTPVPNDRVAEVYSEAMTERTYARMLDAARERLASGRGVVLDATFARRIWRERAAELARVAASPFLLLHCRADDAEVRRRLRARADERGQFSDADIGVYERAREQFEAPAEVTMERRVEVASPTPPEELAIGVLERLLASIDHPDATRARFVRG